MANTMKKSEVLANARESALSTLGLLDIPGVPLVNLPMAKRCMRV